MDSAYQNHHQQIASFRVILNPSSYAASNSPQKCLACPTDLPAAVIATSDYSLNWYDSPTRNTLLQSNSVFYLTDVEGTYYAETYDPSTGCTSTALTAIAFSATDTEVPSISG